MKPPHISSRTLWFFRLIVRLNFWWHFHAVRVSDGSRLSQLRGPLIVYGNHASWWDPMVAVLLAQRFLPGRAHFAPMEAESLSKHGILQRVGVFPVQLQSVRGAAQFMRTGLAVLQANGVLWITPQGRFADARERPLGFKPGLAALAARVPGGCTLLPLAVEYVYWNERQPQALMRLGEPVHINATTAAECEPRLEAALLKTMAELEALALRREASGFHTILGAKS